MKTRSCRKAQVITIDFLTGFAVFIVIIIMLAGTALTMARRDSADTADFELEFAYANLESNLRHDPLDPLGSSAFLSVNRVDAAKLSNFVARYQNPAPGDDIDLDTYVLGEIGNAHGIGMNGESYDICFYFRDEAGIVGLGPAGNQKAIGRVKDKNGNPVLCHDAIAAGKNPCEGYKGVVSTFRPVLFDRGDPQANRIIQMNIVLCRK
jgi:hypothetical protein